MLTYTGTTTMAIHTPQHRKLLDKPLKSAMAERTPNKAGLRALIDAFFGTGQVTVPREAKHVRFVTLGGYFAAGQMSYRKHSTHMMPFRHEHIGCAPDYDSDDDEEATPFPWDEWDAKFKDEVDDEGWDECEILGVSDVGEYQGYDHPRREVAENELTLVQRRAPMKISITLTLLATRTRVPISRAPLRWSGLKTVRRPRRTSTSAPWPSLLSSWPTSQVRVR